MPVGLPIGRESGKTFRADLQIIHPGTAGHLDEPNSERFGVSIRISLVLFEDQSDVFQNLAGHQGDLTRDAAWLVKCFIKSN